MKKILLALSLLLIIPITAFADEELPKVLSLEATTEGVLINYNGTTEADSHAVMCKLYDSKNKEIDMLSVAVDNKKFEGTFTTPKAGEYKVACANYEGGAIKETTVTTEEVIKKYTVTFYTNGGSSIDPVDVESGLKVSKQKDPTKDEYVFVSWCVDETLTTEFNFDTKITDNVTLYAKWEEDNNTEEYTVTDDYGNSITFSEEEGHEFNLVIIDIMKLSDEELAEFDITREEYNEVEKNLKAALSDHGTLLSFYDISVFDEDENNKGNGPFKIKIKMTEEMKKYNSFKILYVDVDEEITIEKSITLKIEDGYLVGTLPHLSNYALMGSIVTDNQKTLDNIYVWIITLMISFVGLTVVTVFTKKQKNKKTR